MILLLFFMILLLFFLSATTGQAATVTLRGHPSIVSKDTGEVYQLYWERGIVVPPGTYAVRFPESRPVVKGLHHPWQEAIGDSDDNYEPVVKDQGKFEFKLQPGQALDIDYILRRKNTPEEQKSLGCKNPWTNVQSFKYVVRAESLSTPPVPPAAKKEKILPKEDQPVPVPPPEKKEEILQKEDQPVVVEACFEGDKSIAFISHTAFPSHDLDEEVRNALPRDAGFFKKLLKPLITPVEVLHSGGSNILDRAVKQVTGKTLAASTPSKGAWHKFASGSAVAFKLPSGECIKRISEKDMDADDYRKVVLEEGKDSQAVIYEEEKFEKLVDEGVLSKISDNLGTSTLYLIVRGGYDVLIVIAACPTKSIVVSTALVSHEFEPGGDAGVGDAGPSGGGGPGPGGGCPGDP
jgi:hypothetical protein